MACGWLARRGIESGALVVDDVADDVVESLFGSEAGEGAEPGDIGDAAVEVLEIGSVGFFKGDEFDG